MTTHEQTAAIVLAAGRGKRMKSNNAKVLHCVSGRPMLDLVLDTLEAADIHKVIIITGHDEKQVRGHIGNRASCVTQHEQLGTGHAVMQAEPALAGFDGLVVITCGDAPLWRADTIRGAISEAWNPKISGIVLTTRLDDPTGYGRVIRGPGGIVKRIVEQRDATKEEARICEINSGTYCFRAGLLFDALKKVTNQNAQGEYYLTDVIEILIGEGHRVLAHGVDDPSEAMGVNSRMDLAAAEEALQRRTLVRLMENGVTVVDPKSTWVDYRVEIGEDTILFPNTVIRGKTVVGPGCRIGPNTELVDARIGAGAVIRHSVIEGREIDGAARVGPFVTLSGDAVR